MCETFFAKKPDMEPRLHKEVSDLIDRDFHFRRSPDGQWWRQGECPECKKKSLYTSVDHPWVLRCERLNKCGAEIHIKELYPELFVEWSKRYPVTQAEPNAAADAYLSTGRGFDLARIKGWYKQESYYDHRQEIGSATVRFALPGGGYWERIIDRPERFGDRKANFSGSYGGAWWCPPNQSFTKVADLWLVEGIFDAIALIHHGIAACSLMSCNNYPAAALSALAEQCAANHADRPQLVFAFDGDKAGRAFAVKYVRRAREEGWAATAAQIPQTGRGKLDWNDMHQRGRLEAAHIEDYLYHGALLVAESALAKAVLIYSRKGRASFYFGYDNRLFWWKLDLEKYNKAREELEDSDKTDEEQRAEAIKVSGTLSQIGNFFPTALYYMAQTLTDEAWYYFRIDFPHDGPSMKNTFTASALTGAAEFKKRILHMAPGAVFSGTTGQLDAIVEDQTYNIKVVQTVDFVGYAKEHGAWVFGDLAIKGGKLYRINEEDFFDLGKLAVKTLSQSVALSLNPDRKGMTTTWVPLLWQAFGAKGVVALAYWLGSLFAEQIRAAQASYPFLEVVGEAGSGKTTLIEFLWKLCGRRDYEGFDPSKSTLAARARNFAQVANLPVVLIESDRDGDAKKGLFDWDELKTAFNGRSTRSRGMKNGGNETYEPPFRGAIVIAQNDQVQASEAILSRIVHVYFDRSAHTPETRVAAEQIERTDMDTVSGFLIAAALHEVDILARFAERQPIYDKALQARAEIRTQRVAKNHAQIMALVDCLPLVVPVTEAMCKAAVALLADLAVERQQALNSDHPMVQEFWELFEYIEGDMEADGYRPTLNHSRNRDQIAINLNHFEQVCADRHLKCPPLPELKRVLKTSRAHKFMEITATNSAVNAAFNAGREAHQQTRPSTVKCWIFKV